MIINQVGGGDSGKWNARYEPVTVTSTARGSTSSGVSNIWYSTINQSTTLKPITGSGSVYEGLVLSLKDGGKSASLKKSSPYTIDNGYPYATTTSTTMSAEQIQAIAVNMISSSSSWNTIMDKIGVEVGDTFYVRGFLNYYQSDWYQTYERMTAVAVGEEKYVDIKVERTASAVNVSYEGDSVTVPAHIFSNSPSKPSVSKTTSIYRRLYPTEIYMNTIQTE